MNDVSKVDAQYAVVFYLLYEIGFRPASKKSVSGLINFTGENIKLHERNNVKFKFVQKSITYDQTHEIDKRVYKLLEIFLSEATDKERIFKKVKYEDFEKKLEEYDEKLSATHFRKYRASLTFQKELQKLTEECIKKNAK